MKRAFQLALALVLAGSLGVTTVAAQEEMGGGRAAPPTKITVFKGTRTQAKTVKVEVPVDKVVRLDTPEFRGEGYFQQKCGVCHLGRWRKAGQLQPILSLAGVLKNTSPGRETAVRDQINRGSINMPGFQNAFTPTELNELVAYLKTL